VCLIADQSSAIEPDCQRHGNDSNEKEGLITIQTSNDDASVFIEVEDNGQGMSDDVLQKVFDPFFTTKDPGKGTGLGLSVSQKIIQDHAGSLTVVRLRGWERFLK
jgi:C4-dicarboxylate-specific signal transduction histidine kinase